MGENINTNINDENDKEVINEEMLQLEEELKEHKKMKPKKTKLHKFFIIMLIVLIVLTGIRVIQVLLQDKPKNDLSLTNVAVQTVETGDIAITTPVSGKLVADDEASVVVTLAGEVTTLNVKVGDHVNKGDLLYAVDSVQTQEAYNQAKIACDTAKTTLNSVKTSLDRTQTLYDQGAVALSDLQAIQTQYTNAQLGYQQAQSGLAQAQSALSMASVTAPISGYVSTVNLTKGTYAMAGTQAVTISDISKLKISTSVSEYLISAIKEGDSVQVYIKSASDQPFTGKISSVGKSPATGSLTYPIEIKINNTDNVLKAGMFAEVLFASATKNGVVKIPSQSVIIRIGQPTVAVVNGDKVELRQVTTGIDNGEFVEITSGLSTGEQVVIKGQNYVSDGETVKIVK